MIEEIKQKFTDREYVHGKYYDEDEAHHAIGFLLQELENLQSHIKDLEYAVDVNNNRANKLQQENERYKEALEMILEVESKCDKDSLLNSIIVINKIAHDTLNEIT